VDSGFRAHVAYAWCRERPNAFAVKGGDGWARPAIGLPTLVDVDLYGKKIKNGATLWTVGTYSLKNQFYADLRKQRLVEGAECEPAGCCHFGEFLTEEYFKQITAEYLGSETIRGRIVRRWLAAGPNHWLDCRIYNLAIADYLGLSRMTSDEWRKIAKVRGVSEELMTPNLLAPLPVKVAAPAQPEQAQPAAQPAHRQAQRPGPRPPSRSRQSSFMN
jgi:phage terminase large subunit GpA-like protein